MVQKFSVLTADPPWRYDFVATKSRKIENQYPTMSLEEIKALGPRLPVAENAVLFLWATAPKLRWALEVMDAWGFAYKTHAIWSKKRLGMGYWFRGAHELLLVGTRGHFSPPSSEHRRSSVFEEPRGPHSKKPDSVQDWIDEAFPHEPKLELFARRTRPGWSIWGDQAPGSIEI